MADNQPNDTRDDDGAPTRKQDRAQVPPGSKTGSDIGNERGNERGDSAGGGATVRGPGGPDSGSDAMPGQSNAL